MESNQILKELAEEAEDFISELRRFRQNLPRKDKRNSLEILREIRGY